MINPSVVGDLTYVNAWHDSMYGRIVSSWKREKDKLTMEISVPANCLAIVYVPFKTGTAVLESGRPAPNANGVKFIREENGKAVFEVGSGNYSFQSMIY
jgi:alpha-L-rhamnosidase